MKKLFFVFSITLLGTLFGSQVMGQDNQATTNGLSLGMPELNLLNSASAAINLVLTTTVAGQAVKSFVADSTARLKISSIVAGSLTRTLSAQVTTGTIPAGTTLKLRAQTPNTNFGGTPGTLVGSDVTLSTGSGASIITGIGSCYSGTIADDGYKLKYTWGLDNPAATYGLIRASNGSAVTVTLTLSAGL
jgi:hypothetical protein